MFSFALPFFSNGLPSLQGIPEVGDIVVYFMDGHRTMFPRKKQKNLTFSWFSQHQELRVRGHVLAEVKDLQMGGIPFMVSVELTPINNEEDRRVTGEPFRFLYEPNLPRRWFILPKSLVDRAMHQNFKVRRNLEKWFVLHNIRRYFSPTFC